MFNVNVKGGTHAGWRTTPSGVDKCSCGGFISPKRIEAGASKCLMCEGAE